MWLLGYELWGREDCGALREDGRARASREAEPLQGDSKRG